MYKRQHRKRWGPNSRTHFMNLGATTIYRIASLLLRFFRQIPRSTFWTHVGSNMQTTSDYTGELTEGEILTTPFFGFLGKFTNCSIILRFYDFFPPRHNTSKTISRNAGQRQTKRNTRQSRRVSRARRMATPQGTASTRVTSSVIARPAWLVAQSAVQLKTSFCPVDGVNSPT